MDEGEGSKQAPLPQPQPQSSTPHTLANWWGCRVPCGPAASSCQGLPLLTHRPWATALFRFPLPTRSTEALTMLSTASNKRQKSPTLAAPPARRSQGIASRLCPQVWMMTDCE